MRKEYFARFERDMGGSGRWIITVPGVQGCRTEARTVARGIALIRDALSLFVDDSKRAEIVPEFKLPRRVQATLDAARRRRERAAAMQSEAAGLARQAVRELTEAAGLTRRDAAAALGISPQRVQQLLEA